MSSTWPQDSSDVGVGDPIGTARNDNFSPEKIQLQATKNSRESSPIRGDSNPSTNIMTASAKVTPNYRKKPARSAMSSREASPIRANLASAGKSSSLSQKSYNTSSQQKPEGPLSPRSQKPQSGTAQWPSTARLGSNKPHSSSSRSSATSSRKPTDPAALSAFPPSVIQLRSQSIGNGQSEDSDDSLPSGMKTPRATASPALETVLESSVPSTPAIGTSRVLVNKVAAQMHLPEKISEKGETERAEVSSISTVPRSAAESESESGYRSEDRLWQPPAQNPVAPAPSRFISRRPTIVNTGQNSETSSRNMTVETETVTSMLPLGGVGGTGASIRSKKSTDTIRPPKKEKKKTTRKAINSSGNPPSSKADIFAAKVAEAVDEANSSDSNETFVYESNPPEPSQRPSRYHSRTPSATSIHDIRTRNQSLHDMGGVGARSKKFARYTGGHSTAYDGDGVGFGGGGGNSRHYGSGSQSGGNSGSAPRASKYPSAQSYRSINSINADESPFIPSHKSSHQSVRQAMTQISSRTSPPGQKVSSSRSNPGTNGNGYGLSPKRSRVSSRYGVDEEAADDERSHLLSSQHRASRYRTRRPGSASLRQLEHNQFRRGSWIGRYAGCIIAVATIFLVISGTIGFMFATSKPLEDVKILSITDVLVSQQEIMLDLTVQAVNPNVVGVTVQSMDINLFAKSSWVRDDKGKDKDKDKDKDKNKFRALRRNEGGLTSGDDDDSDLWHDSIEVFEEQRALNEQFLLLEDGKIGTSDNLREPLSFPTVPRSAVPKHPELSPKKGVDEGTDPDPDPDEDKQTMLLGRILHFDSALIFDGSPFQHRPSISKGGIRLAKPGNKTEEGGTERWERVRLHPFELIVRGILKYQLPLSGRIRSASIGGSVMVNPVDDPTDLPSLQNAWSG